MKCKSDIIKLNNFDNAKTAIKLTVFLITYNHEQTLRDTFDSILKQKICYPFVVKILEDCSTDSTLEICREYVERYPELFQLIAQPTNTKAEHIRWAMESEINTPYWCFIEGDDYYTDDNFLNTAISFLDSNREYNAFCAMYDMLLDGEIISMRDVYGNRPYEMSHDLSFNNYIYCQTSARVYRSIFDFKKMSDYPVFLDIYLYFLYLYIGKVYFYKQPVSVYRITPHGSWSSKSKEQKRQDTRQVCRNIIKYFGFVAPDFIVDLYPKQTMKRLNKVFSSKFVVRIIWAYEKLFGNN